MVSHPITGWEMQNKQHKVIRRDLKSNNQLKKKMQVMKQQSRIELTNMTIKPKKQKLLQTKNNENKSQKITIINKQKQTNQPMKSNRPIYKRKTMQMNERLHKKKVVMMHQEKQ